jgi:hypothetical protein
MDDRTGVAHRRLTNLRVHWGPQVREHLAVVPLFEGGYRVLGLVGLAADADPVWYPGVPLVVQRKQLVFRSSHSEASPQWSEVPPGLLEGVYFLDPWGAILSLVPRLPGAPSLEGAVNLATAQVRGERPVDLLYEPALHRVRAIRLRGRWGGSHLVSVLRLPALAECTVRDVVPQLDITALGPPPQRPESWVERIVRRLKPRATPGRGRSR